MVFILLVYNSGDQNVLINDFYACLQVLSKQLAVLNAYLSLLGYNLVIAPVLPLICPCTGIEMYIWYINVALGRKYTMYTSMHWNGDALLAYEALIV